MRRAVQSLSAVLVSGVLFAVSVPFLASRAQHAKADDAEGDVEKQAAQARKERFTNYMRDFAESTAIRLADGKGEPEQAVKLVPNPVFRYSDEERFIPDAT